MKVVIIDEPENLEAYIASLSDEERLIFINGNKCGSRWEGCSTDYWEDWE